MAFWLLILLIVIASIGVGASALASQRARIQKQKEKQFNQSKATLMQLEPMIDKLLRINCRRDIIDCLISYYSFHTSNIERLFPGVPEVISYKKISEQLPQRTSANIGEHPLTDANELSQVQTQIRQVTLLFSTLRSHNLTSPSVTDEWSKYLKSLSVEIEIKAYMAQSEKLLEEGDRSKASNCLRTAQSKLNKAGSVEKTLKKQLHDEIAGRIRNMYGLDGSEEGGEEEENE